MKMKNSLDQLLGSQSRKRVEDHTRGLDSDIDVPTAQSSSTLIRSGARSRNSSKENVADSKIGLKAASTGFMNSDFCEKLFSPQMGLFAKLKADIDEIAMAKKTQSQTEDRTARLLAETKKQLSFDNFPAPKLEKGFDLIYNMFSGFGKQSGMFNSPFSLEALTKVSNNYQQAFYPKIENLRGLEQQLGLAQTSENRFGSKKSASQHAAMAQSSNIKVERRGSIQEVSSLNSLDEEIDTNIKPASCSNSLSISSINQLDFSPNKIRCDLTLTTKRSEEYKPCVSLSFQDFSNAPLEQKLEIHHTKNSKCKSLHSESSEPKGASKSTLGTYTLDERISKILKYKKKIVKWRLAHPPNRNFSGRSAVAGSKPRIKGKFVKKDEYQKYVEVQKTSSAN
jgi:hypothetical protein